MKKISRKGRPRKDAITKLKVMAWFRAVAEASGKSSAQLEREFADPNHIRRSKEKNQEIRPGLWDKYRRGEVEPRARPIKENRVSVVQAVEAKYPGTARVLTLPLWRLLDFSQPMSMAELDAIEKTLSPVIKLLHARKNMLATTKHQTRRVNNAETPSPQLGFSNAIDRWTMKAISMRKRMLTQRESLIELVLADIETAYPHKQKK